MENRHAFPGNTGIRPQSVLPLARYVATKLSSARARSASITKRRRGSLRFQDRWIVVRLIPGFVILRLQSV